VDTIVAIGAHGGRLDHILSNLSTLHTFRDVDIVLCGDGNLSRLVPAGKTVIKPHRKVEGPSCGLIPLQGRAVATSKGLRWNLEATEMEIGGLVSTSNIIDEDEVWVETDVDLIWTTELNEVH
jgi:thiamine pyrophosphokinase